MNDWNAKENAIVKVNARNHRVVFVLDSESKELVSTSTPLPRAISLDFGIDFDGELDRHNVSEYIGEDQWESIFYTLLNGNPTPYNDHNVHFVDPISEEIIKTINTEE